MKLLIDANLSSRVAQRLRADGYKATHVFDEGLGKATDEVIFAHAGEAEQVIVSADTDFGALLAAAGTRRPSAILLRSADRLTPDQQADLLLTNLPTVTEELKVGAMVTLTRERLRVRPLPIRPVQ